MTEKEIRSAALQAARQACLVIARSHSGAARKTAYECVREIGQMIAPDQKCGSAHRPIEGESDGP
jgi:hypothetical protein